MYLADGTPWLPADAHGRARVWQWLSFEQERVESQVGALRHWRLTGKLARRPEALVAMKQRAATQALAILDAQFAQREWIAGDAISIADIALFAYAGLAEEAGLSLAPHPHLHAWIARMQGQPGFLAQVHPYSMDPHAGNELR